MNFGYALGQGIAGAAQAGAGIMDKQMQEAAEMRAADRRLQDQERLLAAQEMMQARADERRQRYVLDAEGRAEARLTDPARAKSIAEANAAGAAVTDQLERDRTIARANDPLFMQAQRRLKQNEQVMSPLDALRLKAGELELKDKQALSVKQAALSEAMSRGDEAAVAKLTREISILGGKGDPLNKDFSEREKARAAALTATLKDIDATPEEKKAARAELDRLTSGKGGASAGQDPLAALGDQLKAMQEAKNAAKKPPAAPAAPQGAAPAQQFSAVDESGRPVREPGESLAAYARRLAAWDSAGIEAEEAKREAEAERRRQAALAGRPDLQRLNQGMR